MKTTYAPFDVSEYLDNEEAIAEYLTTMLEGGNPDVFLAALGDVAKARIPAMKPSMPYSMR